MDEKMDKRTEGNDILKEAMESEGKKNEFFDYENETIVFRRAYKQTSPPSDKEKMEHTAQIRGGAVVRPLRQAERPADAVITPQETPSRQRPQDASGQQSKQAPSAGNRHIQPSKERQTSAAQKRSQIPPTNPPKAVTPASKVQKSGTTSTKTAPAPSVSSKRPASSPQKSVVTPQRPAVPKAQSTVASTTPGTIKPSPNTSMGTKQTAEQASPSRNLPLQRPKKPAPNTTALVRSSPVRGENDDFEIDEAATNASFFQRRRMQLGEDDDNGASTIMSLVKAMIYIIVIIVISVGMSVFIINTANDIFKFVVEDKMVSVTIPEYATIDDVTDALYDAGAIKYKWAFRFWSNLKDADAEFIPGIYEVSTTLNYDYLRASFKKSSIRKEVRITIPEGYTVDEIIDIFLENGIGTKEGFVDAINNYDFDYPFLEGLVTGEGRIYRLEGYLFPDTYNFYQDSSEVTVIKKLLDNFNNKFVDEYYARCTQLGLTVDEAITLASMVEKETRYADELGYVSSVFHNRLKYSATFPYLNSDATIIYAMAHDLGGRPDGMSGDDKEYDTLYNTYKYKGLPPSAIANPGLNAIKYALYPNESNYFYFVSDSSGRTLFATTEPEHLANINTIRQNSN